MYNSRNFELFIFRNVSVWSFFARPNYEAFVSTMTAHSRSIQQFEMF